MRKKKKRKAVYKLCVVVVLHALFFVTQLISVNPVFQHASMFVFAGQATQIKQNASHKALQQEADNHSVRLNKKFSNADFFEMPAYCLTMARFYSVHVFTVALPDRHILPGFIGNKPLRGPPVLS